VYLKQPDVGHSISVVLAEVMEVNMSDEEEMILVDEAFALVQIENPHLDPDVQWDEIREMAIAIVVSKHEQV
jgi:hypothetical protein